MFLLVLSIMFVVIGMVLIIFSCIRLINRQKKHFFTLITGIVLTTLSIPLLINELYKFGTRTQIGYVTLWETKDALTFYGSYLAFLGTFALGGLALWQNQRFKNENEISQKRIEAINKKLVDLEDTRDKEKIFEYYFQYIDKTENLFDPIYILGMPKETRTELEIIVKVLNCEYEITNKKRRLLFMDKPNIGNDFYKYIDIKIRDMKEIVKSKENQDELEIYKSLFAFWTKNSEEYRNKSLKFMLEIHKSIFGS